ncbi:MAG: polyprenyl synthetase family protein, partial [Candidatus Diapherotrites archaeon]|nr:polyprenyl synthetase family protein [Candidatus Diapherotrites archaeon]
MAAIDTLLEYKKVVDERLNSFFDEFESNNLEKTPQFKDVLKEVKDFNSRGKRIRPAFVIAAYEAVGGKDRKAVADASLGIELAQGFFLIHDDIMDQDELRRGHKTVHTKYKDVHDSDYSLGDREHFGTSMGILAGDINLTLAYYPMINAAFPADVKIRALNQFNDIIMNTCHGQVLDFTNGFKEDVSPADSLLVDRLKTAKYTIEGPLLLGGILGGASDAQLKVF